jgi:phenylacetate-coenzyme A ligase PaaK-like adenylate-forming protein
LTVSTTTEASRQRFFESTMDLVADCHPWYSELMRDRGLRRSDFCSPADLSKLPVTTKDDYVATPELFRLQLDDRGELSVPERTLAQVVYTTGSTAGRPTPFYDTNYDHASRIWQLTELARRLDVDRNDRVLNLFPITPVFHQGFLTATYAALTAGAELLAGFTGAPHTPFDIYHDTEYVVELLRAHRPTVLWGIGSYVRRVVVAASEEGVDLAAVRLLFLGGEAAPSSLRADLRQRLASCGAHDVAIQNGYGFTEMQGPAFQCVEDGPFHPPTPAQYLFEIVDPATDRPLPDGEEGKVLVSHLNRRGTVLLRYAVGDVSTLEDGACPSCGRVGPRFVTPPRRFGSLVKIKGTLVNPHALTNALLSVPDLVDFHVKATYKDAADALAGDELVIEIAADAHHQARVVEAVREVARRVIEVTPTIRIAPPDFRERIDVSYKVKRFQDERTAL